MMENLQCFPWEIILGFSQEFFHKIQKQLLKRILGGSSDKTPEWKKKKINGVPQWNPWNDFAMNIWWNSR